VAPIPSRWQEGEIPLRPYDTPTRQAALIFALYGIRRQMRGDVPGDAEATITITAPDGRSLGRLNLDVDDVERLSAGISTMMDTDFGPFDRAELQRLIRETRDG
jgi:hypothetical protein